MTTIAIKFNINYDILSFNLLNENIISLVVARGVIFRKAHEAY